MARLWTTGLELNSTGEFTSLVGAPTIVTSPIRNGFYALRTNATLGDVWARYTYSGSGVAIAFYRFYLYIATAPDFSCTIFGNEDTAGSGLQDLVVLNNNRTLQLNGVGTASSALNLNTWYMIETKLDMTTKATSTSELRLNGVSVSTGTADLSINTNQARVNIGVASADIIADLYFDDIAINDTSGSTDISWPGELGIVGLTHFYTKQGFQ